LRLGDVGVGFSGFVDYLGSDLVLGFEREEGGDVS